MPDKNRRAPDISSPKKPRRRSGIGKILPLLLFALFALFILKEQFPLLDDKFRALVKPAEFGAIKVCREAAVAKSNNPAFARLIHFGKANKTQNGYFIDYLTVGEMVAESGESRFSVTCHINQAGELANFHAEPYYPALAAEPVIPDSDSD